jgi:hypothetical protein
VGAGGWGKRVAVVVVSWSCLLGVQPASVVDTPEPKDHIGSCTANHSATRSADWTGRVADLDPFYTVFWIAWILFIWFSRIRILVFFGTIQALAPKAMKLSKIFTFLHRFRFSAFQKYLCTIPAFVIKVCFDYVIGKKKYEI